MNTLCILLLSALLYLSQSLYAMQMAVNRCKQQHFDCEEECFTPSLAQRYEWLVIVKKNYFFEKAVPDLKRLASRNPVWNRFLNNAGATGLLIMHVYYAYEQKNIEVVPAEMAIALGTAAALDWCKGRLLRAENAKELDVLRRNFLNASWANNFKEVKKLVEAGVEVKTCSSQALIYAVKHINYDMVQFLLDNGADPGVTTPEKKMTPVMMIVQQLYQAQCSKQDEDCSGNEALLSLFLAYKLINREQKDAAGNNLDWYLEQYKMSKWSKKPLVLSYK